MAQIRCPKCRKKTTDELNFCVNCGYKREAAEPQTKVDSGQEKMAQIRCPKCGAITKSCGWDLKK